MANKNKTPLTAKQRKRRYRGIQYGCVAGEFLSVLTPYIVIGAINFDEYFIQTGENAWKVSLGGMLAMAIMGIAIWSLGHETTKRNKTQNLVMFAIGWLISAFILFLLSSIIYDIAMIMFCGAVGILGALGLDLVSNNYKGKADRYKAYIEDKERQDASLDDDAMREAKKLEKIEQLRKGLK